MAAAISDADELKMFARDDEDVKPVSLVRRSSGVAPSLAPALCPARSVRRPIAALDQAKNLAGGRGPLGEHFPTLSMTQDPGR